MGIEFNKWAELIITSLGDISLKCPPLEWILDWMEGRNEMKIKGCQAIKTIVPAPLVAPLVALAYI